MNSSSIFIFEPQTPQEFEAYYLLRYEILRKPWNQPIGSEKDDMENNCFHAIAVNENKDAFGVCRLQFNSPEEAQLRYMAVQDKMQGNGVGKKLVGFMENKAKLAGAKRIILQSRSSAVEFYKKCGYSVVEKSYLMWGEIQHYLMIKQL